MNYSFFYCILLIRSFIVFNNELFVLLFKGEVLLAQMVD